MPNNEADARKADALALQVYAILKGQGPDVQGAVLADCTSMWLAGYVASDVVTQNALREHLLTMHIEMVRALLPINEALIRERLGLN